MENHNLNTPTIAMRPSAYIQILVTLGTLLVVGGCSRSNQLVIEPIEQSTLSIRAMAVADPGTTPEAQINSLRVLIFQSNAAGQDLGLYYNKPQNWAEPLNIRLPLGYVRIVMVANELPAFDLPNCRSMNQLKSLKIATPNVIKPPFVMYATKLVQVTAATEPVTLDLIRTVAKVTFNVTSDFLATGVPVELDKLIVSSMPASSFLEAQPYIASGGFINPVSWIFSPASVNYTPTGLSTINGGLVFYIPEYLVDQTAGTRTRLTLVLHTKSKPTVPITYDIILCDGMDRLYGSSASIPLASLSASELSISRNMHYKIDARIVSAKDHNFGINVVVQDWRVDSEVDGSLGDEGYFQCSPSVVKIKAGQTVRVDFWTSKTPISFDTKITCQPSPDLIPFTSVFEGTPDGQPHFTCNASTQSGTIILRMLPSITPAPTPGNTSYLIYLTAGNLKRLIEVYIVN
ncbi:MAG: hypothetical protein RR465_02870 [Mucinivorans sp.]